MTNSRYPHSLPAMNRQLPLPVDVFRIFGKISDHSVVEILEANPTMAQLEEVSMWLSQGDDVMGEARLSLSPVPARILELLMRDEEFSEDQRE